MTETPHAPAPEHPYGGVEPRYTPEELAELLNTLEPGDARLPTREQSAVISAPLTPRLVVAGAGSGKTATMVDRVGWLVANGVVAPDQVLGVTFTRKAAGELGERMRARLNRLRTLGLVPEAGDEDDDVPSAPQDPTVSTYHSYANTLVRNYGLRIGIEPDTTLLGQAQTWQLAALTVEAWTGELLEAMPAKSTMVKAVLDLASACAEHLVPPSAVERFASGLLGELATTPPARRKKTLGPQLKKVEDNQRTAWVLAELVAEFSRRKDEAQAMDFGDLLSAAARLAEEDPVARRTERERHRVVLLDEFQDTSHAQLRLFAALFGHGHSVMAVGDPQQSIYGFRGASSGQLFGFYDSFPVAAGQDGEPSFLTTAWRNSTRILDVANTLAVPLRSLPEWARGSSSVSVPPLGPRPGAGPGEVRLSRYATDVEEAAALAEQVQARREEHRGGREEEMPTMAVLCRKRSQIEPVRRELAARGIPYEVVGLGGLLSTPEVGDVVATLRVLDDPGRSDALVRLLAGARWRIGARDLMALSDWAAHLERRRTEAARAGRAEDLESPVTREEAEEDALVEPDLSDHASLIEALETLPRPGWVSAHGRSLSEAARERMVRLRGELDHLRSYLSDDLPSLLHEIETVTGLDIEVASHPHRSSHHARRNLDAFQEAAQTFVSSSATGDVSAFLAWLDVTLAEENGLEPGPDHARRDAVQLVTVHSSKGLEWDHVYVPGLNAKNFPTDNAARWTLDTGTLPWPLRGDARFLPQWSVDTTDLKALEDSHKEFLELAAQHAEDEERRLAYVAVTRARDVLELSCTVFRGTAVKGQEPSVFVAELEPLTEGPAPVVRRGDWAQVSEGARNPAASTVLSAPWPYDPLEGPEITETVTGEDGGTTVRTTPPPHPGRRAMLERAARAVLQRGFEDTADLDVEDLLGVAERDGREPDPRRWSEEARILLARHEEAHAERTVPMPSHVSASTLVALSRDPEDVVSGLRRPMPRRPGTAARRGTTFHAWVEQFYGSSAIFDVGELPGSADEYVDVAYDLPELAETFRSGPWADRQPYAVEFPLETPIAGVTVRGRVDAVFRNADGTWELVDWKTGRAPAGKELQERSAQLAVYRLAWSRLRGVPLEDVTAAFYYVAENRVVRPHDLAGADELEAVVREAYRVVLRP
ncbi:putative ATP-dependent DNA helicase [Kocuria dechangensis]|uniref:DNA 3'-5' helicase n=1 Tax=Kocuria dechangensis TaxID=1176249 RepID=A0A917LPN4_9MICC|nr:ATP-dependent DNA helicase [Kocuria dechangensis]GGG50142.1 putative ATP-dependent DNA helicase [Kocuria dechangensis]